MNIAKQEHRMCVNFSRFLSDVLMRSLDDFHGYKMSRGLYNEKKPVVQLWCCHDLQTTDGEFVLESRLLVLSTPGNLNRFRCRFTVKRITFTGVER